jgi:hypothetical protein
MWRIEEVLRCSIGTVGSPLGALWVAKRAAELMRVNPERLLLGVFEALGSV